MGATEFVKEILFPAITLTGAGIGGAIAISTYWKSVKVRRAEWLSILSKLIDAVVNDEKTKN